MTLTRGFIRNAVTTPLDARLMDMAKIVGNADGTPRTGVLNGGGGAIVTTTASTGPMTVNVAIAEFVTSKGRADGVSIFTNDGTVSVPIGAAPGSNSRIDVIWVKHNDDTTGDANALPVFGVTAGVAAGSPVPLAIPTGAEELAQLRVYSGTVASNGGSNVLTNTYKMTAARGGVVPFRTGAEVTAWTNPTEGQQARALDTGALYVRTAGAWLVYEENYTTLSLASGWTSSPSGFRYRVRGKKLEILPAELSRTGSSATVNAAASVTVATLPSGARPPSTVIAGAGTIGVGGNLGASRWYVNSAGDIYFQSMVASGTMATGGGAVNHVSVGQIEFLLA